MISLTWKFFFFKKTSNREIFLLALSLELVKMKMFCSAKYILERMKVTD